MCEAVSFIYKNTKIIHRLTNKRIQILMYMFVGLVMD
jgi:hypothetical protein